MNRIVAFFRSLPLPIALRFTVVYTLKKLLNADASINYSQTGEDAVIRSLLDETQPGIYEEREFRQIAYDTLNGYFVDVRSQRSGMRLP